MIKDHPGQMREIRDGYAWTRRHPSLSGKEKKEDMEKEKAVSAKTCYHSVRFYSLVLQCFGGRAANAAVNSYIVLYAIRAGVSAMEAALLLTIYSVVNFFGRLSIGFIIKPPMTEKTAQILGFGFMIGGSMALAYVDTYFDMAWASGLLGLGFGLQMSLQPLLLSRCFHDRNFSSGLYNDEY